MAAAPYKTDESNDDDDWVGAFSKGLLWESPCSPRPGFWKAFDSESLNSGTSGSRGQNLTVMLLMGLSCFSPHGPCLEMPGIEACAQPGSSQRFSGILPGAEDRNCG